MSRRRLRELSPGVLVATSRTYTTTSTVILDGRGSAVVVDPAWHPDELAALAVELGERSLACVGGVATHDHYDHVLWHPGLGDVPRWASPGTAGRLVTDRRELLAPAQEFLTPELLALAGRLAPLPAEASALPWEGPDVEIVEHGAHATGHLALLTAGGVLIAGDMLSDVELPMPADDDADLAAYCEGLELLAGLVARAAWLVPGHGSPTDSPMARLDADRRYLDDVLAGRPSDDPRIGLPGMPELHAANLRRAAATRPAR